MILFIESINEIGNTETKNYLINIADDSENINANTILKLKDINDVKLREERLMSSLETLSLKVSDIIQNITDIYSECQRKCSTTQDFEKLFEELSNLDIETTAAHGNFVTTEDFEKLFEKLTNLDLQTTAAHDNLVTKQDFVKLSEKLSNLDIKTTATLRNAVTTQDVEKLVYKFSCNNHGYVKIQGRVSGKYLGCYHDPDEHRGLIEYAFRSKSMNIEKCINVCRSRNYVYAGLQAK